MEPTLWVAHLRFRDSRCGFFGGLGQVEAAHELRGRSDMHQQTGVGVAHVIA